MQDIPEELKADVDERSIAHRKELRHPPPNTQARDQTSPSSPLGYYFQEAAHKGGLTGDQTSDSSAQGGLVGDGSGKPLKYYFTQDIPDDAKRQLAFKGIMKAKMESQNASVAAEGRTHPREH